VKPCQAECKFDEIPKYRYMKAGILVTNKMRKCDFCYDRLVGGINSTPSKKPSVRWAVRLGNIVSGMPIHHGRSQQQAIIPENSRSVSGQNLPGRFGQLNPCHLILPQGEGVYGN